MLGNEGKCCDAVLRLLEHRTGAARADLHLPDKSGGDSPRVDLCVRLGSERYVLEHTRVEPFPQAIRTAKFFSSLVRPVEQRLSGRLPGPAFYQLLFPQDPTVGLPRRDFPAARSGLVDWVLAQARPLYERAVEASALTFRSSRFDPTVDATPAGLPYPVTLVCRLRPRGSGPSSGGLRSFCVVSNGENLEAQRVERLRQALADKCPKLHHCKTRGARTVLVLESSDIDLTNSGLVAEALDHAAAGHVHLPDEIYLVETDFDRWGVFPMNSAAEACFPAGEPVLREFERVSLLDLASSPVRDGASFAAAGPCPGCGV